MTLFVTIITESMIVTVLVSAVLLLATAAPPHQGGLGLGADNWSKLMFR